MGNYFRRTLVFALLPALTLLCLAQGSVAQRANPQRSNPQHSSPERAAAESTRPDTHDVRQQRRTETRTTRQRTQAANTPTHDAEQRLAKLEDKLDTLLREIRQLRLEIRRIAPNSQSRSQMARPNVPLGPGRYTIPQRYPYDRRTVPERYRNQPLRQMNGPMRGPGPDNRGPDNRDSGNRDSDNRDSDNRDSDNRDSDNRDSGNRDSGNRGPDARSSGRSGPDGPRDMPGGPDRRNDDARTQPQRQMNGPNDRGSDGPSRRAPTGPRNTQSGPEARDEGGWQVERRRSDSAQDDPARKRPQEAGRANNREAYPRYLKYAQAVVAKHDGNKDGALTKDEWTRMGKDYSSADSNKDGRLTPEELSVEYLGK